MALFLVCNRSVNLVYPLLCYSRQAFLSFFFPFSSSVVLSRMQISSSSSTASLGLAMSVSSVNTNAEKPLISITNNSIHFKSKPKNILQSIAFRGMIIFQIIAYGSYSILVHLCEKNGSITFSSTTMNFYT